MYVDRAMMLPKPYTAPELAETIKQRLATGLKWRKCGLFRLQ
jgi:hypothetical protein